MTVEPTASDLTQAVRALANLREQEQKTKAALEAKETELWPQLKDLKHVAAIAKQMREEAEAEVLKLLLSDYENKMHERFLEWESQ